MGDGDVQVEPQAKPVPKWEAPSPILYDDDPVLRHVARLAGATYVSDPDVALQDCNGLTLEDMKAACYQAREELAGEPVAQSGLVIRADRDGWAVDTAIVDQAQNLIIHDEATSQALFGTWMVDDLDPDESHFLEAWDSTQRLAFGYNYDMHLAAAIFCDMWASAVKTQFDFNDGSGNYARSQKYQHIRDTERSQRGKSRVQQVEMDRYDTAQQSGQGIEAWFQNIGKM